MIPVWKLLTHWRKMLLQLAAETPQLSPLSITHILSCLEATLHWSETWFEILTKVQWYEYSSYIYLVDSRTAFRSLLCDQCFRELYCKSWTVRLIEGLDPSCYFRRDIHPAEGWKLKVRESQLVSHWQVAFFFGFPRAVGESEWERRSTFPPLSKTSICVLFQQES